VLRQQGLLALSSGFHLHGVRYASALRKRITNSVICYISALPKLEGVCQKHKLLRLSMIQGTWACEEEAWHRSLKADTAGL
jgi:hypothetical protein